MRTLSSRPNGLLNLKCKQASNVLAGKTAHRRTSTVIVHAGNSYNPEGLRLGTIAASTARTYLNAGEAEHAKEKS